jgi:hypothetical protein
MTETSCALPSVDGDPALGSPPHQPAVTNLTAEED